MVAPLDLLGARALDSLPVGTPFFALGLRFGWRTSRRRAVLALVPLFAALDCLYLPALPILDIPSTVRNEAAAAGVRIGQETLRNAVLILLAAAAFVAIFFLGVPFPLIILAAALAGRLVPGKMPEGLGMAETTPGPLRRRARRWRRWPVST